MSPNKVVKAEESLIDQLCGIAGVSRVVATNLLEACDNNLEMALNMQMEGVVTDSNGASFINNDDDNVRAPIPQKREILVEGPDHLSYTFRGRSRITKSVFDKFRDFEAETKRQEEELMEEYSASGASSSGASSSSSGSGSGNGNRSKRKMKTLEDLFRPPLDLMYRGTFQSAREAGIGAKKWLMINVQNSTEFSCQVLNRDVWSNSAVKTIVQEHFIFWQIYHDSEEGLRYMTFYPVRDWPYIAIIDPRTGEKLVEWQKLDAMSFCELVTEFLSTQPSMEDISPLKIPPRKKLKSNENIIEADENAQLEAAIRASLAMTSVEKKRNVFANSDAESDDSDDSLETFDSDADRDDVTEVEQSVDDVSQVTKNVQNDMSIRHRDDDDVSRSVAEDPGDQSGGKLSSNTVVNGSNEGTCSKDEAYAKSANESDVESEIESSFEMESEVERWKLYLGKETDPVSKLMLRLPDGSRESISMPKSSKLMALVLYVASKGFSNESYELVTNFPKRQLSYLNFESSLESAGLFPQETVFVQKR